MHPGSLITERFEVERRAGAGGMSVVYRARDRETGHACAVKVLSAVDGRILDRFDREARLLAELRHPAIVRYVAHGLTGEGARFLAMEWLEGEDLAERLRRAPLNVLESLALARVIGDALGFAHARNVVHRDIKPSNLFLPDGAVERCKVLDFGIARLLDAATGDATRTGIRIGTPAYMSPEQARGLSRIDGRTDVFSLGCVLYESLAGKKAFAGGDAMAVLAKVLLADPPALERVRPDLPAPLVELIGRMLMKDPEARPATGATVAEIAAQLEAELTEPDAPALPDLRAPAALTVRERRLLAVVMARPPALPAGDDLRIAIERAAGPDATSAPRLERLDDGTVVVVVAGTDAATDLAARAARVAIALRDATRSGVALATGRAVVSADLPVGDAIERATALLRAAADWDGTVELRDVVGRPPSSPIIHIDEVTAGLLDAGFEISGDAAGLVLVGTRAAGDGTRLLLGRPTPCVGRDPELAALEATFAACAGGEARAVVVVGAAGVGKSRVRYELLRRLPAATNTWIARGDPGAVSAPFGLLGAALRRAAGILDGEPLELRRQKLRARVARHVAPAELARIAEFLGELIGAPFDDAHSVQLRAARRDPQLANDQMRRAWEDFVAAECEAGPVAMVFEDLHWGDASSLAFVDGALRRLRDAPLFVLALGRPDTLELFPRLWSERGVQIFRLGELPRRAAERLCREVLGARADDAAIARLVERAAGNAFYLEELLRALVEGRGDLPETVLSMVQARLEGMEADARRVLRAASIFGTVFWTRGVTALLGGAGEQVDEWLQELVAREVVSPRTGGRFPGETEYVFRHALVREAAYAMLIETDRTLGHRLAGAWLEAVGEPSATALAEHFERGGDPARAVGWWRRAAEQALAGDDLGAVLAACERGVAGGAAGEVLGALRLLEAEARVWRADFAAAEEAAEAALRWLPPGSDAWYVALEQAASAAFSLGDKERLAGCAGRLDLRSGRVVALKVAARMAVQLLHGGVGAESEPVWAALLSADPAVTAADPALEAAILSARGSLRLFEGNAAGMLELHTRAIDACERAGDLRRALRYRGSAGFASLELGDFDEAVHQLTDALDGARRLGLSTIAATAHQNLGLALAHTGRFDEAREEEGRAAQEFLAAGNRRMEAASRYYLGYIRMLAGDLAGAEKSARAALAIADGPPPITPIRAEGLGVLGAILLAHGRAQEAGDAAGEAMQLLDDMGGIDGGESLIRLAHAEALHATGDLDGARAAIATAASRVRERARAIDDERLRACFLERVPENARTLALAAAW